MPDTLKWAFVGDLQIPYQDSRAVSLFFKVMKSWKPDVIDVVGDIDDQLEYSSFSDGTTDEFFNRLKAYEKENDKALAEHEKEVANRSKELPEGTTIDLEPPKLHDLDPLPFIKKNADGAREFYANLRKQHGEADIHASLGNHDIRIYKYIDKKSPEHVEFITPEFLWGLDNQGITWRHYDDPPQHRYGGIHVHHGATTTTTGLAVRMDMENYDISLVRGHDHRGGVIYKTYPLSGRRLVGMGTGHLCDPHAYGLKYTFNPSWELGFGIGYVEGDNVSLQFVPISQDYTCVVGGRLYKG